MAWTSEEVAQVRAAILKLATGAAVASVSYAGPPARTVSYQSTDLDKLRALLAEMERSASSSPSYRLATTSKGL